MLTLFLINQLTVSGYKFQSYYYNISNYNPQQSILMKNRVYQFVKVHQNKNHTTIGFGAYGEVRLAKDIQTQTLVAIKLIHGRNAQKQIAVHYKLSHPNIIALINDYYDKQKNITYMVMQYADGGTLYDKIKNSVLSKEIMRSYFYQICEGIKYLHQNKLIHRDIKPQNILLTKKNEVKICDFGFATLVGDRMSVCGTYQYMSPQMIKKIPYDQKIDIWALGILLFQMIQGTAPFRGDSPQEVISSMKQSIPFSEKFLTQEISLIKMILRVNNVNRPSIHQILQHKYFEPQKQKKQLNSLNSTKCSQQQLPRQTIIKIQNQSPPKLLKKNSQVSELIFKPLVSQLSFTKNIATNRINKTNIQLKWQSSRSKLAFCKSIQDFRQKKRV